MIPDGLLDAANLDAEMRALAEMAVAGLSQRLARPEAEMDPAEEAADAADGARESEDGVRETSVEALPPPAVVEPPRYNPVSPFRLSFTFGSDGSYSGVEMADPTFAWLESGAVTMKTASVGSLSTSGTVYLNVTLDSHGAFSSAEVSMSRSGSLSVPLYELDASKGVVKDYRHALVVLAELRKKYLVAGDNISLSERDDIITISCAIDPDPDPDPDPGDTEGVTGDFVVGGQVRYSATTHKFTQPLWQWTFQQGVLIEAKVLAEAEVQAVQETLP